MSLIDDFARAVAQMEGFYTPGTIAAANNNPGNLRSWGSLPTARGYAVFSTPQAGWDALKTQIQRNVDRGLTLEEFFAGQRDANGQVVQGGYPGYSPAADSNRPYEYAQFVGERLGGVPVDVPLAEILSGATEFTPSGGSANTEPQPEGGGDWWADVNPGSDGEESGFLNLGGMGTMAVVFGVAALLALWLTRE